MKKHLALTVVTVLAGLFIVAGCATNKKDERSAGRALDDKNLAASIRKSLDQEPVYKFEGVEVKAFAGAVQLSGFVNTEDQKQRAGEIASRTPGVIDVHNALLMKPFAPTPTGGTNTPQQSRVYSNQPQHQPAQPSSPPVTDPAPNENQK